ncbi:MAG: AAA family ATPase [Alphaproteobacteria bacterium]|nr:AAA family ATPase [Alphaproteobacteria bacterium]MCB9797658.1 AAA family ATPase [Alphaproteobacteria bacterium]
MIRYLTVKAFKSLLDVEVELGKVNVFVGANGSGKSNLLEALGVLGAAANGRVDDEALIRRGVRPGLPSLYKSSFRGGQAKPYIYLTAGDTTDEAAQEYAEYRVQLNNPLHDPAPAWKLSHEYLEEDGRKLVGRGPASKTQMDPYRGLAALRSVEWAPERRASRLLNVLSRYAIYEPNTSTLRGLTPDPNPREPIGLSGGRLPQAVAELMKAHPEVAEQALELIDWAASFRARKVGADLPLSPSVASAQQVLYFRDRFMAHGRDGLTGYDASEGALYVLFATVLAVMESAPPLLAIDNVDHGLNPRLARALMARICDWVLHGNTERQLLLTTHNPLVLDGLPLDNDEVRLFAVGRSRKGRTTVNRVQVSLKDLRRDGELWTVSRLWVMGHLGGVPDV